MYRSNVRRIRAVRFGEVASTTLRNESIFAASTALTPDPVFVKFYYSHPPASERLARMGSGSSI